MEPKDFAELLNYISENNAWGEKMYDVCSVRKRRAIKYVDATYDSRDGLVWSITFRSCVPGDTFTFRIESKEDLGELYDWLNKTVN